MALISKTTVVILGQKFNKVVRCDASGMFSIDIPPQLVAQNGGETRTIGLELYQLEKKWANTVSDLIKTELVGSRKVILFGLSSSALGNKYLSMGLVLAVWASVYEERKIANSAGGVSYEYIKHQPSSTDVMRSSIPEIMSSGSPDRFRSDKRLKNSIPWTSEADEFFYQIAAYLTYLTKTLNNMTENSEKLFSLLSGGQTWQSLTDGGKWPAARFSACYEKERDGD